MVDTSTILGAFGNAAALVLFLSPFMAFVRIVKEKSTKDFSGWTYVISWGNCALWVFYGAIKKVTLIMTINSAGLFIETVYTLIFLIYASTPKARKTIGGFFLGEIVVLAALGAGLILGVPHHTQVAIYGWLCVVLNIGMYWAPLSIMYTVIKTKSVEYMPFFLTFMVTINSAFWLCYGILKHNIYVLIPNGLGLLGGVVQLILYGLYFRTEESKNAKLKNQKKVPEVSLSNVV